MFLLYIFTKKGGSKLTVNEMSNRNPTFLVISNAISAIASTLFFGEIMGSVNIPNKYRITSLYSSFSNSYSNYLNIHLDICVLLCKFDLTTFEFL